MYKRMLNFTLKIENNTVFASIKKGFLITLPIVLIGSVALLVRNFPLPIVRNFISSWCGGILDTFLLCIYESTIGFLSVYLVLSISYYYAKSSQIKTPVLHMLSMVTSLICFICSFGAVSGSLTFHYLGALGTFTAILCAIIATHLFVTMCSWEVSGVHLHTMGADDNLTSSLIAIFPMTICIAIFVITNLILSIVFGVNNFHELFSSRLIYLFSYIDNELFNGILFILLLHLFWIFGIHGSHALEQVSQSLFIPFISDPNVIISKSFLDIFVLLGGCGTILCLVLAILLVSHSNNNRRLARIASPMSLFNINEIIVFGLPIVLNPIMVIPFILVPIVSLLIAYLATIIGFIPIINKTVMWTVPVFFNGHIGTGNISGVIVQLVILIVGISIYIPFIRLMEKIQLMKEENRLNKLIQQFQLNEKSNTGEPLLNRVDDIGQIAKILVTQLKKDLSTQMFSMYYQPQVDENEQVIGAEALFRWRYNGKIIYPPLAIALAHEDGFYGALTQAVLKNVCQDTQEMRKQTVSNLHVSINITTQQLNNVTFIQDLITLAREYDVHNNIYLEITEETSLQDLEHIEDNIKLLHENGILVAIDDFGMGQTSITYLQSNNFKYVKLDGQLVRQLIDNPRSCQIVTSIVLLGKNLGYEVIAEYVENQKIKDLLVQLGCKLFQGYHYSPAIPKADFIEYFKSKKSKDKVKE